MSNKSASLFQLSKVSPQTTDRLITHTVHTVNFEMDGYFGPDVHNYFDTRFRFLKACYEFAKELKVKHNLDFDDTLATQKLLSVYLTSTNSAAMITGTEFGVLTTKVIESIKSISKNKYLKDLQDSIKERLFENEFRDWNEIEGDKKKTRKQLDSKGYKEALKNYKITAQQLSHLDNGMILRLFKYELVDQVTIWKAIAEKISENSETNFILREKLGNIKQLSAEFLSDFESLVTRTVTDAKNFIGNNLYRNSDELLESFVNRFYFQFDASIRELEDQYLKDLNEEINSFVQQLGGELVDKIITLNDSKDVSQIEANIKSLVWNIAKLDYTKEQTSDNFVQLLQWALKGDWEAIDSKGAKKGDDGKIKDKGWFTYDTLFLRHPKSAPNYPSIKDKILSWDKDYRTSQILNDHETKFDDKVFMDFWLARCKRIIENSQVYRMYNHVTHEQKTNKEFMEVDSYPLWVEWFWLIINKHPVPDFAINNDKIHDISFTKKSRIIERVIFVYDKVEEDGKVRYNENNRIGRIEYSREVGRKGSPKKLRTATEYLTWKIQSEFNNLKNRHIELGLLTKYLDNIDQDWIKGWIEQVEGKQGQIDKLAYRTENRLRKVQELRKINWNTKYIKEFLKSELQHLESHLLLDHGHAEFKIFDKISFKRYQNVSQMVFEALFNDPKQIRIFKARLAKLLLDSEVALPIKIDRMTANKPNGKSTLVFELELNQNHFQLIKKSSHILVYPINLGIQNAENIKIVDSLEQANKALESGKYTRIFAGFLNGSKDNEATRDFKPVLDQNGNKQIVVDEKGSQRIKGYQVYENWKLKDEENGVEYIDSLRGNFESVGATNPAGYPKVYYFLVPERCNNLVFPVTSNSYYLTKYTPYHHLQKYLNLEKEILRLKRDNTAQNSEQIKDTVKRILQLRARLRYYYRISSLEVDLKQELKLNTKEKKIAKQITAQVHMQFGNPTGLISEIDVDKGGLKIKRNYSFDQVKTKFKTILSIDRGEKIIATATLSTINWDTGELIKKAQFYLPLGESGLDKNKTQNRSDFEIIMEKDSLLHRDKSLTISEKNDTTYRNFNSILLEYSSQQKQYGIVSRKLANKKKNFTDQIAEKISTQIAKIALRYGSFVVLENLSGSAFGSKKHQLSLYTEVYRKAVKKLQKIGLVTEFDVMDYQPKGIEKGIALVHPAFTSVTCSECGYSPRFNGDHYNKQPVEVVDLWKEKGIVEFRFGTKIMYKLEDSQGYLNIFDVKSANITSLLKNKTYFYKSKGSNASKPLYQALSDKLYTDKLNRQKYTNATQEFIRKNLLNPRTSQDTYLCPACGHKDQADYQASYNIGKKFFAEYEEAKKKVTSK